jgi:hypothetical protein
MHKPVDITVTNSTSVIDFERVGGGQWPVWDRFLTIEGKRAYHLGNICGTCRFFFERLEGANQSISATAIADRLNTGMAVSEPTFLTTLSQILPAGGYRVSSQTTLPQLITLGTPADYFVGEQIDLWGIDSFWALPHHPRIAYYRGRSISLSGGRQLFEFIIPMFPYTWLNENRLSQYQQKMQQGVRPTAFTLSILDIKQPANWDGDLPVTEHWCLAHYLLDGHHKTYVAAHEKASLDMVSFLSIDESLASTDQIEQALTALAIQ